jgi:hypothetical protein
MKKGRIKYSTHFCSSSITGGVDTPAAPQQLYTVLQEKKVERVGTALMAPSHVYDIAAVGFRHLKESMKFERKN